MRIGTWRDGLKPLARLALDASLMFFAFAGAMGGYFVGSHFFPRSDPWQFGLAAIGVAAGVVLWCPLSKRLGQWL